MDIYSDAYVIGNLAASKTIHEMVNAIKDANARPFFSLTKKSKECVMPIDARTANAGTITTCLST